MGNLEEGIDFFDSSISKLGIAHLNLLEGDFLHKNQVMKDPDLINDLQELIYESGGLNKLNEYIFKNTVNFLHTINKKWFQSTYEITKRPISNTFDIENVVGHHFDKFKLSVNGFREDLENPSTDEGIEYFEDSISDVPEAEVEEVSEKKRKSTFIDSESESSPSTIQEITSQRRTRRQVVSFNPSATLNTVTQDDESTISSTITSSSSSNFTIRTSTSSDDSHTLRGLNPNKYRSSYSDDEDEKSDSKIFVSERRKKIRRISTEQDFEKPFAEFSENWIENNFLRKNDVIYFDADGYDEFCNRDRRVKYNRFVKTGYYLINDIVSSIVNTIPSLIFCLVSESNGSKFKNIEFYEFEDSMGIMCHKEQAVQEGNVEILDNNTIKRGRIQDSDGLKIKVGNQWFYRYQILIRHRDINLKSYAIKYSMNFHDVFVNDFLNYNKINKKIEFSIYKSSGELIEDVFEVHIRSNYDDNSVKLYTMKIYRNIKKSIRNQESKK